jgi:hypothetical protein
MIPEEKFYKLNFSELTIDNSDIGKLLGYPEGEMPVHVKETLNDILAEAQNHLDIRGGYVIKDILEMDSKKGILKLEESTFFPGKTICHNLKGSEKLICFICTAGEGITRWASETMDVDPLKFYMIDMLGSIVVDSAMDIIESKMEEDILPTGKKITNRYSPGYCGWKLIEQKELFRLFPEGFCNIELTPSSLMLPLKSISGIIGTGQNAEKRDYDCQICDFKNCIYRDLRNH